MTEIFGDKTLLSKGCSNEFPTSTDQEDKSILVSKEVLRRKVVCLFFSASWCAPCQHFVPVLKEIYTELRRRGEPLEIVFLSFDKTEEEMMNYYKQKHGDWLAVKFGDPLRDVLAERYSICVIPKLVVIQGNGDLITSKGRKDVQDKGIICMRSWFSHLVVEDLQNKEDEENVQREENRIAV